MSVLSLLLLTEPVATLAPTPRHPIVLAEQNRTLWGRDGDRRGAPVAGCFTAPLRQDRRPLPVAGGDRRGARHRCDLPRHRLGRDCAALRPTDGGAAELSRRPRPGCRRRRIRTGGGGILSALDQLVPDQRWHAVRAELLARDGRYIEAVDEMTTSLTDSGSVAATPRRITDTARLPVDSASSLIPASVRAAIPLLKRRPVRHDLLAPLRFTIDHIEHAERPGPMHAVHQARRVTAARHVETQGGGQWDPPPPRRTPVADQGPPHTTAWCRSRSTGGCPSRRTARRAGARCRAEPLHGLKLVTELRIRVMSVTNSRPRCAGADVDGDTDGGPDHFVKLPMPRRTHLGASRRRRKGAAMISRLHQSYRFSRRGIIA